MRFKILTAAVFVVGASLAAPPAAKADQVVNFTIGYFAVRAADARVAGDVLIVDRNDLTFNIGDFSGATVGGEWLFGLNDFMEAGAGIGYYQRTVPSFYTNLVNADGTDIIQDLKLRIVPISATVRFFPISRRGPIQPYVGAGVGIFLWRYSETGQFVDANNNIFNASFVDSGTSVGPVAFGGVRVGMGSFMVGGEIKYQHASGDLSSDFLGPKIDLGGWTYSATFGGRF